MENKMTQTKAVLLLVSGMIAVAVSVLLGPGSLVYGFLIGYGYTALAGGIWGMVYTYLKKQKAAKQATTL